MDQLPLPARDAAPPELRDLRRWICWRPTWAEAEKKWLKPPCSPTTGEPIGATQKYQNHYVTFDESLSYAEKNNLGVSFVLVGGDGVVGLDLDHCITEGKTDPTIENWLKFFANTYQELSPSGTGIHILAKGNISRALTPTDFPGAVGVKIEAYSQDRHLTFSGKRIGETTTIGDVQLAIEKLLEHLGKNQSVVRTDTDHPLSYAAIQRRHKENCKKLSHAKPGERNTQLNATAYFAARAVAAKGLPEDETHVKTQISRAAEKAWDGDVPSADLNTARSAWASGIERPLQIVEDELGKLVSNFNKRFFVVGNIGNKCRVCTYEPDESLDGRHVLSAQTFADFRNRYDNVRIRVGEKSNGTPIYQGSGSAWLVHPDRRYYESIVFLPGKSTSTDEFNLWRGFSVAPRAGDCSLLTDHIAQVICGGYKGYYEWYLSQLAYWIQNPAEPGHVAIVHRGEEGTGKTSLVDAYGHLWGAHYISISKTEHLAGRFNRHLLNCCVCHASEAFYAGAKQHASALKSLITDQTLEIEGKGLEVFTVPNRVKLFISSNEEWVVPAGLFARRFAVFDVSSDHREDFTYFAKMRKQLENGGYEALLEMLLARDLSRFNPRLAPQTSGLISQKTQSLLGADAVWFECLMQGEAPGTKTTGGSIFMRTADLLDWSQRQHRWRWDGISAISLSRVLGKTGMEFEQIHNPSRWKIPSLSEARRRWDQKRWTGPWAEYPELLPNDENEEWGVIGVGPS